MSILISVNYGSYNFARPSEKEWAVNIRTPFGNLGTCFTEEPYLGETVLDAVEAVSERIESYWISTSRDEQRKVIAAIKQNIRACEIEWAQQKVKGAQERLLEAERLLRNAESIDDEEDAA